MTNARKQRLLREALGPGEVDVPFPERTIRTVAMVAFAVLVAIALSPTNKVERHVTAVLDAKAASGPTNDGAPPAIAIDPKAAEGNVTDMTY